MKLPKEVTLKITSTPVFFKKTKRYYITRRKRLINRPLVVFMFEGVIGEFMKPPKVAPNIPVSLMLRPGAQQGLKLIAEHFQVAIFFKRKQP